MYDYDNNVSIDDVVKYLFEQKKDRHAQRVMRLVEELKYLQGVIDTKNQAPARRDRHEESSTWNQAPARRDRHEESSTTTRTTQTH